MTGTVPIWVNGRLVDPAEAAISVFDHGLLVGDGVFETVKSVRGRAFALTRHLDRLVRSARAIDLPEPDVDAIGEDDREPPCPFHRGDARQVGPVQANSAGDRWLQAREGAQQRRLAGPVRADEHGQLAATGPPGQSGVHARAAVADG